MRRQLVWTVRLEEQRQPFLWLTHEGTETVRQVERTVCDAKARGETVIVGLATRPAPRRTNG